MLKKYIFYCLMLILPVITLHYSFSSALKTWFVTYKLQKTFRCDIPQNSDYTLTLRQKIHQYYLNNKIYVPLENIIIRGININDKLQNMLEKICGINKIYMWVPLQIKIPFMGNVIIDKCYNLGCNENL